VGEVDCVPVPARVEMIPDDETARTLWLYLSTMKRVPTEFCHIPMGLLRWPGLHPLRKNMIHLQLL
jgi:hypothetical protein